VGIRYIAIAHPFRAGFVNGVRHRRGGSLTCYCLHGCIVDTRASGDGQASQIRQPRRERGQASTTNTSTALCVNRRMVAATERRRLPCRDARPHLEVQFAQLWRRNRDVPAGVISKQLAGSERQHLHSRVQSAAAGMRAASHPEGERTSSASKRKALPALLSTSQPSPNACIGSMPC
jgi:hypothetical protein